ncbi:901_t:CDS:1 [Cetraspora pellucida]|uniref:901_t:CDS:1 n=1 Tax=Cetraspora pellucida TaxID=1433469 RepID=A0A9N9N4J3_9GLOM|nr:901_t:CDS:1 [Cetraspora pellucida]
MLKDLTKLFFHRKNKNNIDGFLFDYERFAKSKGWDEKTQCGMIVLHMLEETKPWVRKLIKTKTQWSDLMNAIVKIINAENDDRIKINQLRNIRQGERETARRYASRFEAYADVIKNKIRSHKQCNWFLDGLCKSYRSRVECFCLSNYIKMKKYVLQIETFQKDREHHDKRSSLLVKEKSIALKALTIN